METAWAIIGGSGLMTAVVSGVVGLCFHGIKKRMDKEEKARKEREEARRKYEIFQVKTLTAVTALSKANAIALKNGECNGETKAALEYLDKVKHEQREFLTEQGIDHLF
jgi:hypothetical protein